jgi:hypothetical protein
MMQRTTRPVALGLALTMPIALLTSCATREGSAGLGAASGALVGAGVGAAIDRHGPEGAIIGGLTGALAGGIVGYAVGRQLEDRDQTLAQYPDIQQQYQQPGVQEVLDIRQFRVDPPSVRAGDRVDITVVHAYVGPYNQVQPFDIVVRLTDAYGNVILNQGQRENFENGTYSSTITMQIPPNLPPGNYGIDVSMSTGRVSDNASGTVQVL